MAAETGDQSSIDPQEAKVVIRPWPKIIFLYPTFMAAVIAGVWQLVVNPGEVPTGSPEHLDYVDTMETVGMVFFLVFAFNLLVISFEFSRIKTVAIMFLVIAIVFAGLFLSTKVEVLEFLGTLFWGLHLQLSTSFYFTMAGYFFLIYVMVFINTRWNYWVIRHNEVIHYTGFLGDIRRFPSPNLRMTKTIDDVFEFLLLGSGKVTLIPQSEREAVVLENVLGVNRKEKRIKRLLSALAVKISTSASPVHDDD